MSTYFKRKESFRYKFPESCLMELRLIDDSLEEENTLNDSFTGYVGHLENLSPSGLCFTSEEEFNVYGKLQFDFDLGNIRCTVIGKILWCKDYGTTKQYGVMCENNQETKNKIIQGLKEHVQLKK